MRVVIALLVLLTAYLQYVLWFERGGIKDVEKLKAAVRLQQSEIQTLRDRNQALAAEVIDLKQGMEAIEERARSDMGLIRDGEIFIRTDEPEPAEPNLSGTERPNK